jgi:hypothetical protein
MRAALVALGVSLAGCDGPDFPPEGGGCDDHDEFALHIEGTEAYRAPFALLEEEPSSVTISVYGENRAAHSVGLRVAWWDRDGAATFVGHATFPGGIGAEPGVASVALHGVPTSASGVLAFAPDAPADIHAQVSVRSSWDAPCDTGAPPDVSFPRKARLREGR